MSVLRRNMVVAAMNKAPARIETRRKETET
jgi:hypothetical protein